MKLFLVDTNGQGLKLFGQAGIKNILCSYHYFKNGSYFENMRKKFDNLNIFLDSGAFSAYTQSKPIKKDEYYDFVKTNSKLFDMIASLDDLKDPDITKQNYLEMVKFRPDIIPTFHYGEDFDFLKYYSKKADYIALGGTVQLKDTRKISNFFSKCFEIIPKEKKVHAFGVFAPNILFRYSNRITSADASTVSYKTGGTNKAVNYSGLTQIKDKAFPLKRIKKDQIEKLVLYNSKRILNFENEINEYRGIRNG